MKHVVFEHSFAKVCTVWLLKVSKRKKSSNLFVASIFNVFYAFYVIGYYCILSFKSILMSLLKYRCHISRILYQGQFPDRIVFIFKRGWSRKSDQILFVMFQLFLLLLSLYPSSDVVWIKQFVMRWPTALIIKFSKKPKRL